MPMFKHQIDLDDHNDAGISTPLGARGSVDIVSMGLGVVYVESPARLLHEQLSNHFEAGPAIADSRWPLPARVAVIVGASLMLWGAIGAAIIQPF